MKKGLRRKPRRSLFVGFIGRQALMKKGLRHARESLGFFLVDWETSPDEEGIKTRTPNRFASSLGIGRQALMKKGLRQLAIGRAPSLP